MTNSHLIGFVTFGFFALSALLALVVSNKHPDVAHDAGKQRAIRRTAIFLFVLAVVFGFGAFTIDNQQRVITLHEVMVAGNGDTKPGAPALVRTVSFTVEHPGAVHTLFLSPTAELLQEPKYPVEIAVSLDGPNKQLLIPEQTEPFDVLTATENHRADWDGKSFSFTPTVTGPHTVKIKLLTEGTPRVKVRIEDPLKRDGERIPGY